LEKQLSNTPKAKGFYWLFGLGLLFFSIFYIDIWHTPNPISRALPVLTYYETGTLEISRYEQISLDKSKVDEKYYSDKAPLPTLITIPFYQTLAKFGIEEWKYQDKQFKGAPKWYTKLSLIIFIGSVICSSLPFVLMAYFSFKTSPDFKFKPILISLTFFGTYLFTYAGTYFNHIFSGACLAFAVYFIQKKEKAWISGLFCAFAFLSEYTLGLFAALLPLFLLKSDQRWKHLLHFGLGFTPALLIYAWYNYSLTGNPFTFIFYYTDFETFSKGIKNNYGFSIPSLESLYGLLLSPYMGLLWFFPVLGFYILNWSKSQGRRLIKDPVLINSLALFLLISSYFIWWGGYSWGPRYLIPMACILALHAANLWKNDKIRIVGVVVLGISFVIQLLNKATVLFLIPDRLSNEGEASYPFTDVVLKAINEGRFNANNLLTWVFDIPANWAFISFFVLFVSWIVILEIQYRKSVLTIVEA
tara:strand:+ start:13874 stop:15292 length:1419 start_codon:yes stop_codon:yes gene_type:complete